MSGFLKFAFYYLFTTGVAIASILYCRRKYLFDKTYYTEKWSEKTKVIVSWVIRVFAVALAVVLFVYNTLPMSKDIPDLLSNKYITCEGEITSYQLYRGHKGRNYFFKQKMTISDEERFEFYFGPRVKKGQYVRVEYLPNSRFVLEVSIFRVIDETEEENSESKRPGKP